MKLQINSNLLRVRVTVALVSVLLSANVTAQSFEAILEQNQDANSLEQLQQLQHYLEQNTNHRPARLLIARLQLQEQLYDQALQTIEPLLQSQHPAWEPWFVAGSAHLGQGNFNAARQQLDTALVKGGQQAQVWLQIAVLEQEQNNHAAALQYLDIAQGLQPELEKIYLNQAYSLERLQQPKRALVAYQNFLKRVGLAKAATTAQPSSLRIDTQPHLTPLVMRRMSALAAALSPNNSQRSTTSAQSPATATEEVLSPTVAKISRPSG